MAGEYKNLRARRVVTGVDDQGRSTIVSDGVTDTRLLAEAFHRNDIWQATQVPGSALADNTLGDVAEIPPPPMGYTYNLTAFPPDSEWDYEEGYARSLADASAADSTSSDDLPGMHTTETVDVLTILSGELWAILETGETLLKSGDTLVQRGTKHAWRNKGDVPAIMVAIQISATRP